MPRTNVETQLAKLQKAKESIEKKVRELLSKTQDKAIARIVQIATDNGVTPAQIIEAMKGGKTTKVKAPRKARQGTGPRGKVAPKYRNPANPEQTWTGRGKSPLWVLELKKSGTLDSALIK
jgi:DNA-binding protein H-NS